jgi:hypothetical protein
MTEPSMTAMTIRQPVGCRPDALQFLQFAGGLDI